MHAIILAAGEGLRLRPLTISKPKVLLPVANKPILQYVVEALVENKIKDIIMVVGYKKESVMNYFEDGKKFNARIRYVNQDRQIGTAHALLQAKKYARGYGLVLAGDNIIDAKNIALLANKKENLMLIAECALPSKYGVVLLENGKLTDIVEKPEHAKSNLVCTGTYLFSDEIFRIIEKTKSTDIGSAVRHLIERKDISYVRARAMWADAVYPWDLLKLNAHALTALKSKLNGKIEKNVSLIGNVSVGKDTVIRANSYIVGPVVIGEQCEIGPNVCIFPSTSIGNNVTIQPFSLIKNTIVMSDVRIGASAGISNSIISEGASIGQNFITESDRCYVELSDGFHDVSNFGTIVGEDTVIGSSVIVDSGKIIGAKCKIASRKRILSNIQDSSTVA